MGRYFTLRVSGNTIGEVKRGTQIISDNKHTNRNEHKQGSVHKESEDLNEPVPTVETAI